MRYHLTEEQSTYFTNLFMTLALSEGVARPTRRNLQRLANKFAPPRTGVFLKPTEKQQVIAYARAGLKLMDQGFSEELPEEKKNHIEKVYTTISEVLEKLGGNEVEDYQVYQTAEGEKK